jgi:hypothetical protein
LIVDDIIGVLYAPQKTFKQIIQNPRYFGAFIVLIILIAAQIGAYYVVDSRRYIEQTMPTGDQGDVWTQNATLWAASPGVTITNNYADFINNSYFYGNNSIQFDASNSTNIQMALKALDGSVNCGADGFKNVSIRVKLVTPDVKPENVTLYLYSLSDLNFFYYDLTSLFSNGTVNVWNNITIPVGSGGWVSSTTAASWENITSLKMDFAWASNSSVELRMEGLFFRGIFKNPLELYGVSYFANSALSVITTFLFEWILLTGLMYVLIKGLKGQVMWKRLMVAVGFALVAAVVEAIALYVAYTALFPRTNYPLEYFAGIPGESDAASQVIVNQLSLVSSVNGLVRIAAYVWIALLGGIITHDITATAETPGFGWLKSLLLSAASFALTFIILTEFLGMII